MSNQKPTRGNRSRKAITAIDGNDEFSVFSVDPEAYRPPVDLGKSDSQGSPEDTPMTSSVVRFFRRIFGE
jgi:hypothetical protein